MASVVLADLPKVTDTHSLPTADFKLSIPSSSKLMNSFTLPPHQPNELGHLSEDPDVQNETLDKFELSSPVFMNLC
jgi:hypothetical protein